MLRALVHVTLALMWASHLTLWSTTAHPLIAETSLRLSVILPRAPIQISELVDGAIDAKRADFEQRPRLLKRVEFPVKNSHTKKGVATQIWYNIPNDLAYGLTMKDEPLMKIPGTEIEVPVVVTRYDSPDTTQDYPLSFSDKRAEDLRQKERNSEYKYPVLQVAPFEPPEGWDKGTAVWIHLLPFLQRPGQIDRDSILKIAKANPNLSRMLYEKTGGTGFVLLSRDQKAIYEGSPSFTPAVSN